MENFSDFLNENNKLFESEFLGNLKETKLFEAVNDELIISEVTASKVSMYVEYNDNIYNVSIDNEDIEIELDGEEFNSLHDDIEDFDKDFQYVYKNFERAFDKKVKKLKIPIKLDY